MAAGVNGRCGLERPRWWGVAGLLSAERLPWVVVTELGPREGLLRRLVPRGLLEL